MDRIKKKLFLEKLGQEIKKAKVLTEKTAMAAKRAKSFSRSQQGDRRYFEEADRIGQESLANLLALQEEVLACPDQPAKEASPVAFVTLEDEDGETSSFYFLNRSAGLSNLQLLTPASPLGKAILGKKEGDKFSYQIEKEGLTTTYSGKVKKVE
jgi:transcription elongation GreA/GreB family factor